MSQKLRSLLLFARKIRLITRLQMEQLGRQTILYKFWPLFRIVAPVLIGYFALGSILESASGDLPYKVFVGSGLLIWLNFAAAVLISLRMASNSERRNLLVSLSSSPQLVAFSYLVPYSIVSLLFYVPIFQFKLSQGQYVEALSLTLITLLLFFVCIPVFLSLALALCVLSTLIRDLRFILPYFSQLLLLASPIFYAPRTPNTFIEEIWTQLNFLNFLISQYRELIVDPSLEFKKVIILTFSCLMSLIINRSLNRFVFVIFVSMEKNSISEIEEE